MDSSFSSRNARKETSVLGIISLIFGILGLPLSMIPCVSFLSLPLVGIGLLLGIIGLFVAKSGENRDISLPIAGTLVSPVGLVISLAWIGAITFFVKGAQAQLEQKRAQEEKDIGCSC